MLNYHIKKYKEADLMNDIHNLGQSGCKTLEFNLYPRK